MPSASKPPQGPGLMNRVSKFLLEGFKKDNKAEEQNLIQRQKTKTRRSAVCAEVTSLNEAFTAKVVPKTDEAKKRLQQALQKSYLFAKLDEEQTKIVIDAVEEVKYKAGNVIIKQGDPGDCFYLLEEGGCEVWMLKPGKTEPDMLKHYVPGDSFGELALLYNSPRAATIKATMDCTLWAMDRMTFRTILLQTTAAKRKLYEDFLGDVPLLKSLDKYDRAAIADVLNTEYFEAGQNIIVEGHAGDKFYILEEGDAEARKGGKVLMKYKRGDYFGELALLNNKPRAATVCAITRCKCVSIDRQSFKRLFGKLDEVMHQHGKEYECKPSKKSVSWFGKSA